MREGPAISTLRASTRLYCKSALFSQVKSIAMLPLNAGIHRSLREMRSKYLCRAGMLIGKPIQHMTRGSFRWCFGVLLGTQAPI